MSCAKVEHHLPQKFGVMRFHFERRNQVAKLVDLGHCFSNCFAGPEAAHWQKYPLTAVSSCLAGPNICQVKPAAGLKSQAASARAAIDQSFSNKSGIQECRRPLKGCFAGRNEACLASHTAPKCLHALASPIHHRVSAFAVAIGCKADMACCSAYVCF